MNSYLSILRKFSIARKCDDGNDETKAHRRNVQVSFGDDETHSTEQIRTRQEWNDEQTYRCTIPSVRRGEGEEEVI